MERHSNKSLRNPAQKSEGRDHEGMSELRSLSTSAGVGAAEGSVEVRAWLEVEVVEDVSSGHQLKTVQRYTCMSSIKVFLVS